MLGRVLFATFVATQSAACGASSAATAPRAAHAASAERAELERARAENERAQERIRELEAHLALARAELADLRDAQPSWRDRGQTVRIGEPERSSPADPTESHALETGGEDDGPIRSREPRVVLRLHGTPQRSPAEPPPPLVLPPAPPGVSDRLPVAAVDDTPVSAIVDSSPAPAATEPARTLPPPLARRREDPIAARYASALELVRERRFGEAIEAFGRFLVDHPQHQYADNALYWRGESFYALRDYRAAVAEFERVVRGFPRGNKVADALLKIGLCHQRMGDLEQARRYFRRVREQFPDSVAATMAPREDA